MRKLIKKPNRKQRRSSFQSNHNITAQRTPVSAVADNPIYNLQRAIGNQAVGKIVQSKLTPGTTGIESKIHRLRGGGKPMSQSERNYFEPRFGVRLDQVRLHTDENAAKAAKTIRAKAFTLGQNVVFGKDQYAPESADGKKLMAHELTHVAQQYQNRKFKGKDHQSFEIQRKALDGSIISTPEIDYKKTEKENKKWAKRLGWADRLIEMKLSLAVFWSAGFYQHFANAVMKFQTEQGFGKKKIDGILGPRTWDRLRPIGEVIAKQKATWSDSSKICYEASKERMLKGYSRATGEKLVHKEEKEKFKIILRSNPAELKKADVDKKYWGTSAAGALVFLGKGEFVNETDIWDKKLLKPGAIIQVWKKKKYLENIKKGKKPPFGTGTSAIFVKYVGKNSMRVIHFESPETWRKNTYKVWIGANLLNRKK